MKVKYSHIEHSEAVTIKTPMSMCVWLKQPEQHAEVAV